MILKDYYKILGLENSRVSLDDIKLAYRAEAKKYHPDLNIGDKLAEDRIKDINEAYRVLSVPSTKRKYDRKWNAYVGKSNTVFSKNAKSKDVLKVMFFGNEVKDKKIVKPTVKEKNVNGDNIETQISISLKEAFMGVEKDISIRNVEGNIKTLSVKIPKGINNGEKIRLIGQGKQGIGKGKNGDMLIKVNIKDDRRFKLKGNDIETVLKITPWEATLGTRVAVQSLDDETNIYIPEGVQSGEKIKIPAKGYNFNGKRGDLIIEIMIVVPKRLTKQEKELMEQLKSISKFNPRI